MPWHMGDKWAPNYDESQGYAIPTTGNVSTLPFRPMIEPAVLVSGVFVYDVYFIEPSWQTGREINLGRGISGILIYPPELIRRGNSTYGAYSDVYRLALVSSMAVNDGQHVHHVTHEFDRATYLSGIPRQGTWFWARGPTYHPCQREKEKYSINYVCAVGWCHESIHIDAPEYQFECVDIYDKYMRFNPFDRGLSIHVPAEHEELHSVRGA